MNKYTSCVFFFLLFEAASAFSQFGKYKPFKLVIISPDSAVIDTSLKANGDTLENRYLLSHYSTIKLVEEEIKKKHARDSTLKKHYIEGEQTIKAYLDNLKRSELYAKRFRYYQVISEFSSVVYNYYFNESPPYSTFKVIPKANLAVQNLSRIADSLRADYVIGFKNIHTEKRNGQFFLELTTVMYSRKEDRMIFETETSGDEGYSLDGMWTCMNPLSCLLKYAVKSSSDKVFEVLNKRQFEVYKRSDDDLKGSYPILNKTLELLKRTHLNNYNDENLYTLLLNRIDSVFQLGLKITKEKDKLRMLYHGMKVNISDRNDFIKCCNLIQQDIKSQQSKQHFETDYDYYLADLLVFIINSMSFVNSKEVAGYHSSCLDIIVDKYYNFIINGECFDNDHNTIKTGSVISKLNNIPIKYFTYGTLNNFLFKNRNSTITMQLIEELKPRYIDFNNCNIYRADGFEYMIDLNDNCYIKINSYLEHKATNILWELLTADCHSIKSIIVDLRNQRGGSINEAIDVANLFLKPDLLLAELITKGPDTTKIISMNYNKCEGKPMYVFINGITSGSGEIIAGILKEFRNATLIGEKTMSNVNVQVAYRLSENYCMRIYHGVFKIANKYSLGEEPILPDFTFDSPEFGNLKLNDFR